MTTDRTSRVAFAFATIACVQATSRAQAPVTERADSLRAATAEVVTGPSGHLRNVIAGQGTMKVYLTPAPEGGTASNYPPGTNIVGQDIQAPAGFAFLAMFNVQVSDWDPQHDGSPLLRGWQTKVDAAGLSGTNATPSNPGCDLSFPVNMIACGADVDCEAALGPGSACANSFCGFGFQDIARSDWLFLTMEPDALNGVNLFQPAGPIFFGLADVSEGVTDQGGRYYAGTLAVSVPSCAVGTYTIDLFQPESFAFDPSDVLIPILEHVPGRLVFPTVGSCCWGIGSPVHGCEEGLTQAQCGDDEPSPFVWSPGGTCANDCVFGSCCYGTGTPNEGCIDDAIAAQCGDDEPAPVSFAAGGNCSEDCTFGSCCFGLGTPNPGCVEDVIEADCGDDEPGPFTWTPGGSCPDACAADGSNAFTYQGSLEKDEMSYTGTADTLASLWTAEENGLQIGSNFQALGVSVFNGVFTTQLDFGPGAFDGTARWLELHVRTPADGGVYTPLAPRVEITPAPMAAHAVQATAASALDAPDGDPINAVYVDDAGRVGIGRTPSANALEVEGDASKTAAGSWLANSDRAIKTHVRSISNALEAIDRLRPVVFRYTDEYKTEHPAIKDQDYYNYIAQEFGEVFPTAVQRSGEGELLQMDSYPASIYAVAAIQELHALLLDKDCELETLRAQKDREIAELKERMARLEALLDKIAARDGDGQ